MAASTAKIKICGITNQFDARLAVDLGADMLGFNFYPPSPRFIQPAHASQIIKSLTCPHTLMVGLFVNTEISVIKDTLATVPLDMVQLHGDETNEFCREVAEMGLPVLKALRIRSREDIGRLGTFDTEYLLLDAFDAKVYGGSGRTFDWSWLSPIEDKKILLAGGITPENITAALAVGTWGIDLCSGVEKEPGIKDPEKMKALFEAINRKNQTNQN